MEMIAERSHRGEHRRGRIVRGDPYQAGRGADTPTTDSGEMEDDGMGGCKLLPYDLPSPSPFL